jgi:8-oxo-dGTP pyrophosphatase MutT (NUDIX family)
MLMLYHLVATLIIQGERVLLGRRSSSRTFYPNVWDVFGGHVEPGEQPVETLIRELQEEYVVDVRNGFYVLKYHGPFADEVTGTRFLEGNSNLGEPQMWETP